MKIVSRVEIWWIFFKSFQALQLIFSSYFIAFNHLGALKTSCQTLSLIRFLWISHHHTRWKITTNKLPISDVNSTQKTDSCSFSCVMKIDVLSIFPFQQGFQFIVQCTRSVIKPRCFQTLYWACEFIGITSSSLLQCASQVLIEKLSNARETRKWKNGKVAYRLVIDFSIV